MNLSEWLQLCGFSDNPFGQKQAGEERDNLHEWFVEHPEYNALIEKSASYSSILHARRGAGKSTTCLMLEEDYRQKKAELRPLIVHLKDWLPLLPHIDKPPLARIEKYMEELFRQMVVALGEMCTEPWVTLPADATLGADLAWLVATYDAYLLPQQWANLERSGFASIALEQAQGAAARLERLPGLRKVQAIIAILQRTGFRQCYVFVDGVDETEMSMRAAEDAARLLAPLVSNQQLLEVPALVYKFFLPTEVVDVMHQHQLIRTDRLRVHELRWDGAEGEQLLREMLNRRLAAFSDNTVSSLDALATLELRGILDTEVIRASGGSPRALLLLGDLLFEERAKDPQTSADSFLIERKHLESALRKLPDILASVNLAQAGPSSPNVAEATPSAGTEATEQRQPEAPSSVPPTEEQSADAVPLLSIEADGSICRGGVPIEGWNNLPKRQRQLLSYLYEHAGKLRTIEQLIQDVWEENVGDDAVRKIVVSLAKFIEPDTAHPCYIKRVRGEGYLLKNTTKPIKASQ